MLRLWVVASRAACSLAHRAAPSAAVSAPLPVPQTLEILGRPGAYEHLERITKKLVDGLLAAGRDAGHDMCGSNISGMFGFFFCKVRAS